jgi:outer membrane protein assembly factor BamB
MKRLASVFVCALATLVVTGKSGATPSAPSLVSQGVVKWRFQVSGQYVLYRPAVGPDGGVVVASSTGDVYSLTAAGAVRWVVPSVGGSGGPSIGADGTVYVASMSTVTAIAADGLIKWTFTEPSVGQGVIAGPTVGPDGNIYAISDLGGLGAFALSPAGELLWSNPGNPTFAENGQLGAEIVFGSGRLYAAFDERGVALSTMFGLSLGGAQQWASAIGGSDDPFMQQQRQPATGLDGSLYLTAMGGGERLGLEPRRSGQRQRPLELLPVPLERDVGSQRGA